MTRFPNRRASIRRPTELRVGLVGYSALPYDKVTARRLLRKAFSQIEADYPGVPKRLVSGLTNMGIPAQGYKEAVKRGWATEGISCSKARGMKWFPVSTTRLVGKNWGDESPYFLRRIHVLVRVGGGSQAKVEVAKAKRMAKPVYIHRLQRKMFAL